MKRIKFMLIQSVVLVLALSSIADVDTWTLEEAARMGSDGSVERAKKMLATGKYDDHLDAALCSAAHSSTLEMVKVLVEAGADVNAKASCWGMPLHNVANRNVGKNRSNGLQIAKYLVSKGAKIDAKNGGGMTPLYTACEGNPDVAVWLLDHGADPNVEIKAIEHTPLLKAASKVQERTIVKLVEKGADVNVRGYENNTPLHYAASGKLEATKALIEAGADVNAVTDTGDTPLHISARFMPFGVSYQADIAKLLLKAGADPYIKNKRGKTVFDVFEKWVKKWQGDTFNIWGGKGLTDEQFECLKKWRTEMPKILEAAKKKHKNELKDVAKIASTADKSINIHQKEKSGLTSGLATGSDVSDDKTKLPFKIGLLIIGLLVVACIGEFIIKKHK